jgi:glycosyltransferase involved in cell wall biosynthesis
MVWAWDWFKRAKLMNERRPTVSVVIPCYNYGRYLYGCVGSVLSQEGVDVKILIIDDRSTDDSWEIAQAIAASDSRVTAWHHEENRGHIATYNEGLLGWADGDYVALLSADDQLTRGSFDRSVATMGSHPGVGMVYGRAAEFSDEEQPQITGTYRGAKIWERNEWLARRCREGRNVVPTPSVLLRTSVQHGVGGYDPGLPHAGDFEMWLRVAVVADVAFVRGVPQALYRVHPRSMSQGYYRDPIADVKQRAAVFEKLFDEHGSDLLARGISRDVARRSIANEVMRLACRAYEEGTLSAHPVGSWVEYARTVWPDAYRLPAGRALRRRERLGERICARTHLFVITAVARRIEDRLWWRRWRRLGG